MGDVPQYEYDCIKNRYDLKIARGTKHDIKTAVKTAADCVQEDFRITEGICDCGGPFGMHDTSDADIIELSNLIRDLSVLPGAKQINICITWTGKQNKREIKLKLSEIDLEQTLADMSENTMYSIYL
ncbi:MAG: hypothetical protein K5662_08340 [Lachnospiraceae bacterium]|nr:hypothetical protein [Lachnospiraceae bacterium]